MASSSAFSDPARFVHTQVQDIRPDALQYVLLDLPGLLFFTTYTLLVLFWAEIYHQACGHPQRLSACNSQTGTCAKCGRLR